MCLGEIMKEDDKLEDKNLSGTLPLALILTVLVGFVYTRSEPYLTERPSSSSTMQFSYESAQDIDARLWQDPFAAVHAAKEPTPKETTFTVTDNNTTSQQLNIADTTRKSTDHDRKQIYKGVFDTSELDKSVFDKNKPVASESKITVLAVTLPGGPYHEDAEQRMRRRYAVLSALSNQNAIPHDEQHIGYFFHSYKDTREKIPFEWWSFGEKKDAKKILLLWLDEKGLSNSPINQFKGIFRDLFDDDLCDKKYFRYIVIGPNSSTLLQTLLAENVKNQLAEDAKTTPAPASPNQSGDSDKKASDKDPTKITGDKLKEDSAKCQPPIIDDQDIAYYSAAATASDKDLFESLACPNSPNCYNKSPSNLHRTTATDAELMDLLVEELLNRNVNREDNVVILSEWDTFYGRTMRKTFKHAWPSSKTIHEYVYMRGLDGVLENQKKEASNASNNKAQDSRTADPNVLIERPEGQNQKDYVRRLASKLLELDQSLKDKGNKKGVAAIGILGSDVHDKLLILEALRKDFPHKLFFTTDIDAIYSHPAKRHDTHNLLIATPFGLSLREELQGGIPPFRDNYQTAFFLATQLALTQQTATQGRMYPPRLFEIGRSRPIPLPTAQDKVIDRTELADIQETEQKTCSWKDLSNCKHSVHMPLIAKSLIHWNVRTITILAIVIFVLTLISWQIRNVVKTFTNYLRAHPFRTLYGGIGLFLLISLLFKCWNLYAMQSNAEPFYWLEGVSIWPSQCFRLAAFLFAGGFYFWGKNRLDSMRTEIQQDKSDELTAAIFALPEYDADKDPLKDRPCDVLFVGSWTRDKNCQLEHVDTKMLWRKYLSYQYKRKLKIPGACLRVIVHGVAFILLARLLVSQNGSLNIPARGDFAIEVNQILIWLAVLSTILLTMWVVENARLCERMIFCLTFKPSLWNKKARNFAIDNKHVAKECVNEWLDIQLVVMLTKTMQPLIWGPILCSSLLISARSPAFDDWDTPWGLTVVFALMLLYAMSAEIFLRQGAKTARAKTIENWSREIRILHNQQHGPDEAAIRRITKEIESIKALRTGAFRPWYEWPLLQSFGGFGSFVILLQYLIEIWGDGSY